MLHNVCIGRSRPPARFCSKPLDIPDRERKGKFHVLSIYYTVTVTVTVPMLFTERYASVLTMSPLVVETLALLAVGARPGCLSSASQIPAVSPFATFANVGMVDPMWWQHDSSLAVL
ncbi:hypothetical protein N7468_008488 [Penicillium chermesinum]|uniref:Uncharacterized protein n=1 Tax=Penicillium chermesinum TaxID=63820 RepID=A0A9W9NQ60_9EURO|nr:uncharacterized protein N7468_008488 [Penicillium chermesinum]KAJ5223946.1 hypothetical protein N7468_008488 [Penicillium chermesinum]